MLMGTPSYMSPEQIEAQPVDGRSDQFALAVLAYELLTGARPFVADSMPTVAHLIVYGPRPSAHAAKPAVPEAVDKVLERALSRLPGDRFASCTDFVAALDAALIQVAPPAPTPVPIPPPAVKKRSPMIYVAGIAAIVIVAVALAFMRFKNSPPVAHATPPPVTQAAAPAKPSPVSPAPPVTAPPVTPPPSQLVETAPPEPPPGPKPEKIIVVPPAVPAKLEIKPDPNAKVPASFRAQEFYNAAMVKRREGKPEEAFALFKESADLDDANAMEEIGECYRTGDGANKDGLEAERWFLRSATKGNSSAMVLLGAMYYLGDDIAASYEDAAKWFQRAADLKNPAAMYDLAKMYEQGLGVKRSVDMAKKWYQDSAALGNAEAQHRLAELARK